MSNPIKPSDLLADQVTINNIWLEARKEVCRKLYLGLLPPIPVYVLASDYRIARNIFDRFFLSTGISRKIDLRYIDCEQRLYGTRNIYIVVSNEQYPNYSFLDRLWWIESQADYRQFEVVYESDLENEQIRQKVSRQRPKETTGK